MCVPRAPLTAHLKGWRTSVRHSDSPYKEQDLRALFQPLTESRLVLLLGLSPKRAQLWLQMSVTLDFPTGRCEHSAAPAPRGSLPAALPRGTATQPRPGLVGHLPSLKHNKHTHTLPHRASKEKGASASCGNRRGTCGPLLSPCLNHVWCQQQHRSFPWAANK